jgi:hypothetical protein
MNFQNILNAIEKADPEIYNRIDSRRKAMHRFKDIGGKLALTAIPLALGSVLNKAYSQTPPSDIVDILNFALTLEYLESEFYATGLGKTGFIDAAEMASFTLMQQQEAAHVNFLTTTITSLSGTPITKPEFDFTGKGAFPNVFSNYQVFLSLAQAFEDLGIRAYKGQVTGLMSNKDVLTAALQIHSVEGRHAAHVRYIRRANGASPEEKPWITGNITDGVGKPVEGAYAGEDNVVQLGITLTTLQNVGDRVATEAFDEPLSADEVNAIIDQFIV